MTQDRRSLEQRLRELLQTPYQSPEVKREIDDIRRQLRQPAHQAPQTR